MQIRRIFREQAEQAEGIVLVIDVIRAFTVAAYAFAGGARRLWLVRTPAEAFELSKQDETALLAGEVGGNLIANFHLNNSPLRMSEANVRGRSIIQCTGAGTRGALQVRHAPYILPCSLVNARSTALYAKRLSEESGLPLTLFPTASSLNQHRRNEDDYSADYLEALLTGAQTDEQQLQKLLQDFFEEDRRTHWDENVERDFPTGDLAKLQALNCFPFVMVGTPKLLSPQASSLSLEYIEVLRID